MKIVIDEAKPEDVEAVSGLLATTWLDTYPNAELGITEADIRLRVEGEHGERVAESIAAWRKRIEAAGKNSQPYVARLDGKIVGMANALIEDGKRYVGAIYVLPEAQRHGVGSMLMQKVLDWLGSNDDIYVIVASYNDKAINFYKRFGFIETGKQIEDLSAKLKGAKPIPEIEMILRQARDK